MAQQSVDMQITAGFKRAAAWLAGMLWFGLVIAGTVIAFGPKQTPVVGYSKLLSTDHWLVPSCVGPVDLGSDDEPVGQGSAWTHGYRSHVRPHHHVFRARNQSS